jgi:predicted acylesterase/phospholipase RssA/CRP-like cAMP-binding protein
MLRAPDARLRDRRHPDVVGGAQRAADSQVAAALAALRELLGSAAVEDVQGLATVLEHTTLRQGETLFSEGDDGDGLFVLTRGRLAVILRDPSGCDTTVDALLPGAVVGEMALLTGQRRSATVRASEAAELVRLPRDHFVRLGEAHPQLVERLTLAIRERLRRTHLSAVLTDWFGPLDLSARHELERRLEWRHLAGGDVLFREGDPSDAMYLVVSGRLRVAGAAGTTREITRGDSVGETGLLTGEPRASTVIAIRDSDLVRLPHDLVEANAAIMAKVARSVALRVRATAPAPSQRTATIAVVPVTSGLEDVARRLEAALAAQAPTLRLDAVAFDHAFRREGDAALPRDHALAVTLTSWLSQREADHAFVLYEADPEWSGWTQRCVRQADRVVLVADASNDPTPGALERLVRSVADGVAIDLVLVHDDATPLPSGTLAWLEPRPGTTHHHVRRTRTLDIERVARHLSGRAVGVVCSGGGARGFVHIGLLRALEERGIAVDAIGGTSMGALVAGARAFGGDAGFCHVQAATFGDTRRLIDVTLPVVALTKSRGITTMLRAMFGDTRIEDLWVPFFCVSTNLTQGTRMVHDRGPVWEAVRASLAIPGVFTPVVRDGDVLVDGALTSNYPVDLMRERVGRGVVIGSNAFPAAEARKPYEFGASVSGWRLLARRLNPFAAALEVPSILDTLVGSTLINSRYAVRAMEALADLNVSYPVEGVGALAFDRFDDVIAIGHRSGGAALEAWSYGREAAAA